MHSRYVQMFALFLVGVAAPSVHANTVAMTYTGPSGSNVSGFGNFSYTNNALTTVGLGDLSSFFLELDFPGGIPNPVIVQFNLVPDLLAFSATITGGLVSALSFTTDFQAAINTSNFDENEKGLVVNSLAVGGAPLYNQSDIPTLRTTLIGNGTITTQGPTPEPSTAVLLLGGAGLMLGLWRRTSRSIRG